MGSGAGRREERQFGAEGAEKPAAPLRGWDSNPPSPKPLEAARCLNVKCVQCENGKSISPSDSAQPTMAHDADADSDLADSHVHPTANIHHRGTLLRLCYCGVLRADTLPAMLWRTRVLVTRSDGWELLGRLGIEEERAGGGPGLTGGGQEQEDRRADPGRRRLSGMLAEHSLIG